VNGRDSQSGSSECLEVARYGGKCRNVDRGKDRQGRSDLSVMGGKDVGLDGRDRQRRTRQCLKVACCGGKGWNVDRRKDRQGRSHLSVLGGKEDGLDGTGCDG
jgi:hypothetical protein